MNIAIPKNKYPTVSVRLMTYNHASFIEEAIDSCLCQITNFNFEIVIGDDFSTDGTTDICMKYAEEHPGIIRFLERQVGDDYWQKRQKLGRLYNFVNILENCRGQYIALLDGDDCYTDPYKLQKQVDILNYDRKLSFCFHDVMIINAIGEECSFNKLHEPPGDILNFLDILRGHYIYTCSAVFRNDFLKIPDWFLKIQSGDIALELILASKGSAFYLKEKMSSYRVHGGGITNSFRHRNAIAYYLDRKKVYTYVDRETNFKYHREIQQRIKSFYNEMFPKKNNIRNNLRHRLLKFLIWI